MGRVRGSGWLGAVSLLVACSSLLPEPNALITPGTSVTFEAVDEVGPWATITVTRGRDLGPEIGDAGFPPFTAPIGYVEVTVAYEVTRDRPETPYAALVDWTAYGQVQERFGPTAALDWAMTVPGQARLPMDFDGPAAGERVSGTFVIALFDDVDQTWLGFTPAPIGATELGPTPWEDLTHRWLIAD